MWGLLLIVDAFGLIIERAFELRPNGTNETATASMPCPPVGRPVAILGDSVGPRLKRRRRFR